MNEIIDQHKEIFDPFELKNLAMAEEDREILDTDLPERYFNLLKRYLLSNTATFEATRRRLSKSNRALRRKILLLRRTGSIIA